MSGGVVRGGAVSSVYDISELEKRLESNTLPPTLGEFIRERAQNLGDRVACYWFEDDRKLTFRELDDRASRLASGLNSIGVRKGAHVAVLLPNVLETIVTW